MSIQTANNTPTPFVNDWNVHLYDHRHRYVSHLATDLLKLLHPQNGEHILDLGCGTGHLTYRITACGAEVVGVDSAVSMIERASHSYPTLKFAVVDAASLGMSEQFDGVFSNAVLHWLKQPEKVIEGVWQALKPGGRFVAEFGGKGNVETIISGICEALDEAGYPENKSFNPWYFPSIAEYATLLERQGFQLKLATLFDRPTPLDEGKNGLRNWIEMFASCFFQNIPAEQQEKILKRIEKKLQSKLCQNGSWIADYKRIRIKAVKPN